MSERVGCAPDAKDVGEDDVGRQRLHEPPLRRLQPAKHMHINIAIILSEDCVSHLSDSFIRGILCVRRNVSLIVAMRL